MLSKETLIEYDRIFSLTSWTQGIPFIWNREKHLFQKRSKFRKVLAYFILMVDLSFKIFCMTIFIHKIMTRMKLNKLSKIFNPSFALFSFILSFAFAVNNFAKGDDMMDTANAVLELNRDLGKIIRHPTPDKLSRLIRYLRIQSFAVAGLGFLQVSRNTDENLYVYLGGTNPIWRIIYALFYGTLLEKDWGEGLFVFLVAIAYFKCASQWTTALRTKVESREMSISSAQKFYRIIQLYNKVFGNAMFSICLFIIVTSSVLFVICATAFLSFFSALTWTAPIVCAMMTIFATAIMSIMFQASYSVTKDSAAFLQFLKTRAARTVDKKGLRSNPILSIGMGVFVKVERSTFPTLFQFVLELTISCIITLESLT